MENAFDKWWVGLRNSLEATASTVWKDLVGALKGTWAQISPELAQVATTVIPALVVSAASAIGSGTPLGAIGTMIGAGLLSAAKTAGTTIGPQALVTFSNDIFAQAQVHPAAQSDAATQTAAATGNNAQQTATVIAAALAQHPGLLMLAALLKAGLSLIVDSFLKLFTINRDEQIGTLKETNKDQERVLQDAAKANDIDNGIDGKSPADLERLRRALNERD